MSDTVLYDVTDGVATVTLNRPDAMNALDTELKTALRDTLLGRCRGPAGPRRRADRQRPGVLRRAGPRRARGEPGLRGGRRGRLDDGAGALHADRDGARDDAQAGDRGGQRRRGRRRCGVRLRLRLPHRRRDRGLQPGVRRRSGCPPTPARRGRCPVSSAWRARRSCCCCRRPCRPIEALELGLATEVVDAAAVLPTATALAARLAAGPTVAYGAIRRALAFSAGHGIDESLDFEGEMMALTGSHRRPSRRGGVVPGQGEARVRGSVGDQQSAAGAKGAAGQVVVDHAGRLHQRVRRGRADEAEAVALAAPWPSRSTPAVTAGTSDRLTGAGAVRRRARRTRAARRGRRRERATACALAIVASTLARLRTMPASASSRRRRRRRSRRPRGVEAGERGPEGRPLAQDREPGQPGLERLEAQPLVQRGRRRARAVPTRRRGRRRSRARWHPTGSAAGRRARRPAPLTRRPRRSRASRSQRPRRRPAGSAV